MVSKPGTRRQNKLANLAKKIKLENQYEAYKLKLLEHPKFPEFAKRFGLYPALKICAEDLRKTKEETE